MIEEKQVDGPECLLHYAEGPDHGPPVLLLHGIMGSWLEFITAIPALLPRWHVFALDFRGHGHSGRVPGRYQLSDHLQDVQHFVDAVIGGPTRIYGHSLGGMVGLMFGGAAPELLRGLIVGDSLLFEETTEAFFVERADNYRARQAQFRRGLPPAALAQEMLADKPGAQAALWRSLAVPMSQVDPDVLDLCQPGGASDYTLSTILPRITCPVLFLQSKVMSREDAERAVGQLADGYVQSFPELGHLLHAEQSGGPVVHAVQMFLEATR